MDVLVATALQGLCWHFSLAQLHLQGKVMLLDLVVMAMGEMVMGIPSIDSSTIPALAETKYPPGKAVLWLVGWRHKDEYWVWSSWS